MSENDTPIKAVRARNRTILINSKLVNQVREEAEMQNKGQTNDQSEILSNVEHKRDPINEILSPSSGSDWERLEVSKPISKSVLGLTPNVSPSDDAYTAPIGTTVLDTMAILPSVNVPFQPQVTSVTTSPIEEVQDRATPENILPKTQLADSVIEPKVPTGHFGGASIEENPSARIMKQHPEYEQVAAKDPTLQGGNLGVRAGIMAAAQIGVTTGTGSFSRKSILDSLVEKKDTPVSNLINSFQNVSQNNNSFSTVQIPIQNTTMIMDKNIVLKDIQIKHSEENANIVAFLVTDSAENNQAFEIKIGRYFVSSKVTEHGGYLLINHPSVSPLHAVIRATEDGHVQVVDQLSEFGTWIKRQGFEQEQELQGNLVNLEHGDVLRFGDKTFIVCMVPKI